MPTTYATQSVTLPQVLDGVALLVRTALGWDAGRVVEYHFERRNNLDEGRSFAWYQLVERRLADGGGAGRHGAPVDAVVAVNLVTRGFLDRADKDRRLGRDHWANQFLLENAFYDRALYDLYEDRVGDEPPKPPTDGTATVLSARGVMRADALPAAQRPRPEQGWLQTNLTVTIPCVLKLSLGDVPALDE